MPTSFRHPPQVPEAQGRPDNSTVRTFTFPSVRHCGTAARIKVHLNHASCTVTPQVAAEPALLRTLVESLNSLGKANSLHVSLWGTQYEVDMPTLPKDHFAGPSLVHVIRTVAAFGTCTAVALYHLRSNTPIAASITYQDHTLNRHRCLPAAARATLPRGYDAALVRTLTLTLTLTVTLALTLTLTPNPDPDPNSSPSPNPSPNPNPIPNQVSRVCGGRYSTPTRSRCR